MRLRKVEYHLFEHDIAWLNDNPKSPYHDLDREVCMIDDHGTRCFVSWVQDRNDFHLEWSDKAYFLDEGIVVDFSQHLLWADLIGKDVALNYVDAERLAIKVSSGDAHVYLCAYEQTIPGGRGCWGFDGVHIAKDLPQRRGENS